jgi:hypothetical protein
VLSWRQRGSMQTGRPVAEQAGPFTVVVIVGHWAADVLGNVSRVAIQEWSYPASRRMIETSRLYMVIL